MKNELCNSCLIWLNRTKSSIKVFEDTLVEAQTAKWRLLKTVGAILWSLLSYFNNRFLRFIRYYN